MSTLYSEWHAAMYRRHHAGRATDRRPNVWLPRIEQLAAQIGAQSILDYGCGAARGISAFCSLPVHDYDPGVPECAAPPPPADLVVSIHALEHVEPDCLAAVIVDMERLARVAVFVVVSCEASTKVLPDGTPWHSLVRPVPWWTDVLRDWMPAPTIKAPHKEFAAFQFMGGRVQ